MNRVYNLSRLGDIVQTFNGATVENAIKASEDWAKRNNVMLNQFFLQHKIGKSHSIIVDVTLPYGDDDENN